MSFCRRKKSDWLLPTVFLVFVIFGTVISGQNVTTEEKKEPSWWEWWGAKNESDFGSLCETDNDKIGQTIGCDCDMLAEGKWKGSFVAECDGLWLGYNDTMVLPPYLNISRHVRKLDFSRNHLTKIDGRTFGDCEGVFEMVFYKNHIEIVHDLNCSRLKTLDLSWNRLKNLTMDSFKNLQMLTHLDLSHNNLIFLDHDIFSQIEGLRYLSLNSNPIGQELFYSPDYFLSVTNLEYLEELDLGNTTMVDFPPNLTNGTKNLKKLKLNNNRITYIPGRAFSEMTALEDLDLSGNQFETIPAYSFLNMKNLKILHLSRMSRLRTIEAHAFAGLASLVELSCRRNHCLKDIDIQAFRGDDLGEECNPKIVRLSDNNLNYLEFGLLSWKDLEELDLFRNPWICDCNLQWVSEFAKFKPSEASMLMDEDFKCYTPSPLKDMAVGSVAPELLLCYSPAATVAGTIGIIVFCIVLVAFTTIIALGRLKILPSWLQKFNVCGGGNGIPKYTRVHPKPSRSRRMEIMNVASCNDRKTYEPPPDDLEWDNGDIGNR